MSSLSRKASTLYREAASHTHRRDIRSRIKSMERDGWRVNRWQLSSSGTATVLFIKDGVERDICW
jgi:hypothetical protein